MPDDDRFSRYLTPAWRRVFRSLQGKDAPERVADNVTAALAATVRAVHGVPSLPSLAQRMQDAAVHGTALEKLPGRDGMHVPTELAEQAAAALAVTMQRELALVSPAQAALLLAQRVVETLAYHYGLDRMVQKLVKGTYSVAELRVFFAEVLASEPVSKLAARFLTRPTGDGLRAPARKLRRQSLPELMNVSLEAL